MILNLELQRCSIYFKHDFYDSPTDFFLNRIEMIIFARPKLLLTCDGNLFMLCFMGYRQI